LVLASMVTLLLSAAPAGIAPAASERYTVDRSRSGTRSATINGLRTAAEATKFRWRWEKILGPGEHRWTTSWRSTQSGPFCDHTGEGKFCGCSDTSACGQYNSGQEIKTAPFGCDRPERWRLRCIAESDSR
jgi:hypothetical protein